jgi:hypothetical protein
MLTSSAKGNVIFSAQDTNTQGMVTGSIASDNTVVKESADVKVTSVQGL